MLRTSHVFSHAIPTGTPSSLHSTEVENETLSNLLTTAGIRTNACPTLILALYLPCYAMKRIALTFDKD